MFRLHSLSSMRHLLLGAASAIALLAAAAPAQAASVYVTNSGANTVSQYAVSGGKIFPRSPGKVAAGKRPWGVAVSPTGKYVYVTNINGNNVSQYAVSGGRLFPRHPATVPAGSRPGGIAVSPDGHSVYVANEVGGNIFERGNVSQYTIGPGGKLSPKTPATIPAEHRPGEVVVSPDGDSVYVRNLFESQPPHCSETPGAISQYDVGPSGILSAKSPPCASAPSESSGLAISPDGLDVYFGGYSCGTVCAAARFDVGPGGLLSRTRDFLVGCEGQQVVVNPDGRSAYVTNACDQVRQYDRDPTGLLTAKYPAGVAAGSRPEGLAMSANGYSLYVANSGDDTVSQYTVGALGRLFPRSPAKVAAVNEPVGVAVNPPAIP
jgi:DNA-binding beta-propeller fold protein YncE